MILAAVQARPVATISDLVDMTGTSEATIRRDISALDVQGRHFRTVRETSLELAAAEVS